jgi:hypothetical protein
MSGASAIVMLTPEELSDIVKRAVSEAFATANDAHPAALLDRNGLATALGCSASLVDKLRKEGMPSVKLGGTPRFELEACLTWLRERT